MWKDVVWWQEINKRTKRGHLPTEWNHFTDRSSDGLRQLARSRFVLLISVLLIEGTTTPVASSREKKQKAAHLRCQQRYLNYRSRVVGRLSFRRAGLRGRTTTATPTTKKKETNVPHDPNFCFVSKCTTNALYRCVHTHALGLCCLIRRLLKNKSRLYIREEFWPKCFRHRTTTLFARSRRDRWIAPIQPEHTPIHAPMTEILRFSQCANFTSIWHPFYRQFIHLFRLKNASNHWEMIISQWSRVNRRKTRGDDRGPLVLD